MTVVYIISLFQYIPIEAIDAYIFIILYRHYKTRALIRAIFSYLALKLSNTDLYREITV